MVLYTQGKRKTVDQPSKRSVKAANDKEKIIPFNVQKFTVIFLHIRFRQGSEQLLRFGNNQMTKELSPMDQAEQQLLAIIDGSGAQRWDAGWPRGKHT